MFAFYDFETTGTSPAYDQPLQFAAILTDDNFNEVKSVNHRCKLAPHILPSPTALAITKVSPRELLEQDFTLYDFAQELAKLTVEWAPATWVGYNSLSFDENFLRHLFYQNLVPNIFRTQIDGNTRLDVMKHAMACWAYNSKALKIPTNDKGKPTIKLDQLAPCNGFADHHAHDALGDVRATIHVARLVRDNAPEIWNHTIANLDRGKLLSGLKSGRAYHFIDRFGPSGVGIQTGVYCGTNAQNDKRIGFVNLGAKEVAKLLSADEATIEKAVTASPLLIRSIDIGAMPLLFPAIEVSAEVSQLADQFRNQHDLWKLVGQKLAGRYADREPSIEVEDRIFEKFGNCADELKLKQFHKAPWAERATILKDISDDRLRELGNRLIVMYAPDTVDAATKSSFWGKIAKRWSGEEFYGAEVKNPGNTYASVAKDMRELESGDRFSLEPSLIEEFREFFGSRRL